MREGMVVNEMGHNGPQMRTGMDEIGAAEAVQFWFRFSRSKVELAQEKRTRRFTVGA